MNPPSRETMVADLVRWAPPQLVGEYLFHCGVHKVHEAPTDVLERVWSRCYARDCYRRKVDPRDGSPMTRKRLEELAWKEKHPDFRGDGCILIYRTNVGTCSVPLEAATDEELYAVLLP